MPRQYIQVKPMTDLEHVLGYKFKNEDLLQQSLTHASAISENHPMAANRDLSLMAFVGDTALKYAVTRYIFLNGRSEVLGDIAKFHEGVQAVIPNRVLATIGEQALRLQEYLIRGNAHRTPSMNMYADCMEAIFGAIALDCGTDEQEVLFRVIEKLCSDRYENWLVPTATVRFAAPLREHEDELIIVDIHDYNRMQVESSLYYSDRPSSRDTRSYWQKLGLLILWAMAIYGFITICSALLTFMKFVSSGRYGKLMNEGNFTPRKCSELSFGSIWSITWCRRLYDHFQNGHIDALWEDIL